MCNLLTHGRSTKIKEDVQNKQNLRRSTAYVTLQTRARWKPKGNKTCIRQKRARQNQSRTSLGNWKSPPWINQINVDWTEVKL